MVNPSRPFELPGDLQAFAEECVRSGKNSSVAEVVRNALEEKKRAALREAIGEGVAELDVGLGVEITPEQLMAEVRAEAGLTS